MADDDQTETGPDQSTELKTEEFAADKTETTPDNQTTDEEIENLLSAEDEIEPIRTGKDLEAVYDIPVQLSAVLGKATMQVSQLLKLGRGAVVELDRKVGEAIDIYVNDRLVARGEVVVVEERQWLTGVAKLEDRRAAQLANYIPRDFVVTRSMARSLAGYVDRRRFFSIARQREVARHIAEPLIERFGFPADTSYDLLLCALYYRAFVADSSDDDESAEDSNPFESISAAEINIQPFNSSPPVKPS